MAPATLVPPDYRDPAGEKVQWLTGTKKREKEKNEGLPDKKQDFVL